MKHALLAMSALLAGCATVDQVEGPHGEPAYVITCPGTNLPGCNAKASDLCPGGYETIAAMGGVPEGVVTGKPYMSVPASRQITIVCNKPK